MHFEAVYSSGILRVTTVECRPHRMGCGSTEAPDFHSLAFVRKGAYKYHRRDEDILIDPLTAILFASGDEYSVSHPFDRGDDCIDIWFDDELLREARPALRHVERTQNGRARSVVLPIPNGVRRDFSLMSNNIEVGKSTALEIEETALRILNEIGAIESAAVRLDADPRRMNNALRARKKVEHAKEIILSDLSKNWSLGEIACLVGASPFHLTRLARQFSGVTLHQFVMRQRLAVAYTQILDGADDLTRLALDLGFSSHSHFSAVFKKAYGQTPRNVRTLAR